jgi:hypothetical protein
VADYLTNADLLVLRDLRSRGFAVVVWEPSEMTMLDADMSNEDFEDAVCEYAGELMINPMEGTTDE